MSTQPSHEGRRNSLLGRRHLKRKKDHQAAKVDGKGHQMTLIQKLMMSAELMGMEAVVNFQQIYTVPVLQTLGMPLSLTYLPGLVSGPSSILILPVLGWLVDKGNNPVCRRIASIIFAAALQVVGMVCLLLGNAIHFQYLLQYNSTAQKNTVPFASLNDSIFPDFETGWDAGEIGRNWSVAGEDWNNMSFEDAGDPIPMAKDSTALENTGSVSLKAGLAMMGFILMDLGFDASNCFVKSFLVTCSARSEQTSLIVLGVMMGALGGVANSALGLVDFATLLDLDYIDGAKLTIQTSVQGLVIILIGFFGLLSTAITGLKQLRRLRQLSSEAVPAKAHEHRAKPRPSRLHGNSIDTGSVRFHESNTFENFHSNPEIRRKRQSLVDAFETSIRSFGGSSIFAESLMEEASPFLAENVPLLEDDHHSEEAMDGDPVTSDGYGAVESAQTHEKSSSRKKLVDEDLGTEKSGGGCRSCLKNPKVRIGLVCLTTFFSAEAIVMFSFTVSDFVGKAVYEGDPMAEPGSESLNRYQEGMKLASWALLVYFCTYFAFSLVHSKVLAVLGFRVEFPLLQMLAVLAMLLVGFTKRIEAVFVLSVAAALHRTCHYTMPFAVTNEIAQEIVVTGTGRSPVALSMSLAAASIPLSYCMLFTWVGAVEELTGDVSAPLWLGCAAGTLAAITFLFVGKV